MDFGLDGKTAVVLASSAGLGKGIASVLAKEGCNLAICGRSEERLQTTAEEIASFGNGRVFSQVTDVSEKESLERFFERVYQEFGQVEILVNNAGGPPPGSSDKLLEEDYQAAFNLSLMSVIRASSIVLPKMKKQGFGRIITVTSTSVKSVMENMVLSNVFRNAAAAFSKSISMEGIRDGVRVHCVMPGPFLTDRVHQLGSGAAEAQGISFEQWQKNAEATTPLGRFGTPEEMGHLVAFLASDLSVYMTGTCIAIDGGILTTIA
jgi:3-oxoacyl-[acyl-carrier protein] reductase